MYSKNSDQAGPLSGCISCQPRMSMEGSRGMRVQPTSMTSNVFQTGVTLTRGKTGADWK